MPPRNDYTHFSFGITFIVILLLAALAFVPSFTVGNMRFKRAGILSEIVRFNEDGVDYEIGLNRLDVDFVREGERRSESGRNMVVGKAAAPEDTGGDRTWYIGEKARAGHGGNGSTDGAGEIDIQDASYVTDPPAGNTHIERIREDGIIKFEDFTPEGEVSVGDFAGLLGTASRERVVRIAFLGDSFIEGDIITADVREQLQSLYSGQGVGFVPFATPLAVGRATILHEFNGWTTHNLINKRTTPDQYKERYTVSGMLNIPSSGARSSYRGMKYRRHIDSWSNAKLLFINRLHSSIDVVVNDSIRGRHVPASNESIQQWNISGEGIRSLKISVSDPDGFIGYGILLDGSGGVAVDNYSIRSNSGLALFGTDGKANVRWNQLLRYDMIVLQYGLNAMDPDNTNYSAYGQQLGKVINYIRACFPDAAVVLMGVGDRCVRRDGDFVTADAVPAMIKAQRAVALECGIAFWDTFEAMGGRNSMARFAEWNWAAKDYTHLGYRGGKHIATKFVEALIYEKQAAEEGYNADGEGSAAE